MKTLSVYNPGPNSIEGWQHTKWKTTQVTVRDNQQVDLEEEVARALVAEYPNLKIIGEVSGSVEEVKAREMTEPEEEAWLKRKAAEQVMKQVEEDTDVPELKAPLGMTNPPVFCSMCSSDGIKSEFKNKHGLNIHLKRKHNA